MATEVLMPRQGQSVESCIILEWKKQEGEAVAAGDILCEVETDKASFEVESPADGVLLKRLYSEGEEVPVLERIAFIGEEGETVEGEDAPPSAPDAAAAAAEPAGGAEGLTRTPTAAPARTTGATDRSAASAASGAAGQVLISPRARERASRAGVPFEELTGSGPGGRIIERDIDAALAEGTVATRTAADEVGGEAAGETSGVAAAGSGIGGRVTAADRAAGDRAAGGAAKPEPEPSGFVASSDADKRRGSSEQKLSGVRKRIAERMLKSVQGSAQLTLHASADARALLEYRRKLKAAGGAFASISLNDLVLYAVARVLPSHPALNATLEGDTLRSYGAVHLGMAVDTARGLMVPVIRDADLLSPAAISREARRLAGACRGASIGPDELSGGTFTITNLGALGIEVFTPVLNPPQVAILGVCSIEPKPTFGSEGEVKHIPSMGLSLTIDHRVVDGAPAARFLQDLSGALKSFEPLLSGAEFGAAGDSGGKGGGDADSGGVGSRPGTGA